MGNVELHNLPMNAVTAGHLLCVWCNESSDGSDRDEFARDHATCPIPPGES
jgi:hypothetical protein